MCKERSGSEERQSVCAFIIVVIIIIIITHITSIVHIIISFFVCSNVYRSYLAVGILTNFIFC
jgi:hypothetical protein